ncbi:hypothetical protein M758_1G006800 [Ceratodon purpureus]|nr:hypothetical protein M758_1G006800 [Ceratodon purpureus]
MDSFETSSSNEDSYESPAVGGVLNRTSAADGALNETSGVEHDEGITEDEGADQEKGAEEDDGDEEGGPLSGLIDQAKYISESLDNTLATLMILKGNIQYANTKLKENQESSVRTIEGLNKIKSDISTFKSQIEDFRKGVEKGGDRTYSVDKCAEESKVQAEEQAVEKDPVEPRL